MHFLIVLWPSYDRLMIVLGIFAIVLFLGSFAIPHLFFERLILLQFKKKSEYKWPYFWSKNEVVIRPFWPRKILSFDYVSLNSCIQILKLWKSIQICMISFDFLHSTFWILRLYSFSFSDCRHLVFNFLPSYFCPLGASSYLKK